MFALCSGHAFEFGEAEKQARLCLDLFQRQTFPPCSCVHMFSCWALLGTGPCWAHSRGFICWALLGLGLVWPIHLLGPVGPQAVLGPLICWALLGPGPVGAILKLSKSVF